MCASDQNRMKVSSDVEPSDSPTSKPTFESAKASGSPAVLAHSAEAATACPARKERKADQPSTPRTPAARAEVRASAMELLLFFGLGGEW